MADEARDVVGVPRWVGVLALVVLVVGPALAVLLFTGGGHGPGRHVSFAVPNSPAAGGPV